ncbi:hypothetical protein B0H14DRAFT_2612844 [Mycena olivaceomarginata]|nr:hypothetical protein B0H14DRAFT_2612844 [Mycena olivaceomarginata]
MSNPMHYATVRRPGHSRPLAVSDAGIVMEEKKEGWKGTKEEQVFERRERCGLEVLADARTRAHRVAASAAHWGMKLAKAVSRRWLRGTEWSEEDRGAALVAKKETTLESALCAEIQSHLNKRAKAGKEVANQEGREKGRTAEEEERRRTHATMSAHPRARRNGKRKKEKEQDTPRSSAYTVFRMACLRLTERQEDELLPVVGTRVGEEEEEPVLVERGGDVEVGVVGALGLGGLLVHKVVRKVVEHADAPDAVGVLRDDLVMSGSCLRTQYGPGKMPRHALEAIEVIGGHVLLVEDSGDVGRDVVHVVVVHPEEVTPTAATVSGIFGMTWDGLAVEVRGMREVVIVCQKDTRFRDREDSKSGVEAVVFWRSAREALGRRHEDLGGGGEAPGGREEENGGEHRCSGGASSFPGIDSNVEKLQERTAS